MEKQIREAQVSSITEKCHIIQHIKTYIILGRKRTEKILKSRNVKWKKKEKCSKQLHFNGTYCRNVTGSRLLTKVKTNKNINTIKSFTVRFLKQVVQT